MLIQISFYILILLFVFYLLAKVCDEYFVGSLDIISSKLKLSEDVAGATLMAIGSSAPEFFTAFFAILTASEEVGAGTIVGSAIFNILVIIGASAFIAKVFLSWKPVIRDLIFYAMTIVILYVSFQDGIINLSEALFYLFVYVIYISILVIWTKVANKSKVTTQLGEIEHEVEKSEERVEKGRGPIAIFVRIVDRFVAFTFPKLNTKTYLFVFLIALSYIIILSWVLVDVAVSLSALLGIPAVIISLTVLAAGTSIPDLLSSVIVAKQGRGDMAVSNAVGSNVFDILICLGLPWVIFLLANPGSEIHVVTENLNASILLLFFTIVSLLTLMIVQKFKIGKYAGLFLIALYLGYLGYSVLQVLS